MKFKKKLLFLSCVLLLYSALVQVVNANVGQKIMLDLEEKKVLSDPRDASGVPFQLGNRVAFDSKGNIFLRDVRTTAILKFDSSGRLLKIIGQKGQGPGEFQGGQGPYYIDSQDNLYVLDYARLVKFDGDGHFIKNIPVIWGIVDFFVTDDEHVFCISPDYQESGTELSVKMIKDGEVKKKLLSFPDQDETKSYGVSLSIKSAYSGMVYLVPLMPDMFCVAHNQDYRLYYFDAQGNLKKQVKVERSRDKLSREEMKRTQKAIEQITRRNPVYKPAVPKFKPFFNRILRDENRWVYVFQKKEGKNVMADIFDEMGRLRYRAEFPVLPLAIRNGSFYAFDNEEDEEGNAIFRLKCWTIRNRMWQQ